MAERNGLGEMAGGVTDLARDAAYVAVGLGVLGFQRIQVQRVALQKKLKDVDFPVDDMVSGVRTELARQYANVDEWVERTAQAVEATLQPFEEQLPAPAREIARMAHEQVRDLRTKIRSRFVVG